MALNSLLPRLLPKQYSKYVKNAKNNAINLEWPERYISILGGAKLAISGVKSIFSSPIYGSVKLFAGGYLINRGISGHCELYTKLGKNTTEPININIKNTITVDKPREEVYKFWRNLDNLPVFMSHLAKVESLDYKRSHWEAKIPGNIGKISWDAEIVKDDPGRLIGWHSVENATVENAGKVEFSDAPNGGTVVDILITYQPPAGGVGTGLAKLLNPMFEKIIRKDVAGFKHFLEDTYVPVEHHS